MRLFAYLDPGTGTIIVQAILGGVAGVAVLFKTMGRRLRGKPRDESAEPVASEEHADDTQSAPPPID